MSIQFSKSLQLKKGEGRTIKAGGDWIFDNEIARMADDIEDGDIVKVYDFDEYPMGQGYINRKSRITVRMLSRNIDAVIDEAFFKERVKRAWQYRKDNVDISSCRVIFGEADFLPGIVVDKYEDVLVVESLTLGIDKWKNVIIDALKDIMSTEGIMIRGVYERSDAKVRLKEGLERYKGFIGPKFDTEVIITENNVKYYVDVENGQKTGFFLDQKYNRLAMQNLVSKMDKPSVLDCFTHTGSFALNTGLAGAREVLGLDASELAIEEARKNAELNGLSDRVHFEVADVLEWLPRKVEEGVKYDVVILDPPAFTKSRDTIKKAAKGYREINVCGMKLVRNGGYLATCSCSHFMDNDTFMSVIAQSARSAHKRLRQVEFRTQSADHPILWSADESYYLKFYIFQVCEEE